MTDERKTEPASVEIRKEQEARAREELGGNPDTVQPVTERRSEGVGFAKDEPETQAGGENEHRTER